MQISFETILLLFFVTASNLVCVYTGYKLCTLKKGIEASNLKQAEEKPKILDKVKDFVEDIVTLKKESDKDDGTPKKVTTKDGRDKYENDFF
jgi:hypothetical protein